MTPPHAVIEVYSATECYQAVGEDRVAVIDHPAARVIVVADGVGGRRNGGPAADSIVRIVTEAAGRIADPCEGDVWCEVLADADARLCADPRYGETTAVVVGVSRERIGGASVGDSGAWLITGDSYTDLTRIQQRKPFLGSGAALPIPFRAIFSGAAAAGAAADVLLVATDGLLKYASPQQISRVARSSDLAAVPNALIDLVRMPSGKLQDDAAVAVARLSVE